MGLNFNVEGTMFANLSKRLIITTVVLLVFFCKGVYAEGAVEKILLIHSYHPEHQWSSEITAGLKQTINKETGYDLYIEYLDSEQFISLNYKNIQRTFLSGKYLNTSFDLIICAGDPALTFVIENRTVLFRETPVVFCGISSYQQNKVAEQKNITGVYETLDLRKTVELILNNHKDVRSISVINDISTLGQRIKYDFVDISHDYKYIEWVFPLVYSKALMPMMLSSIMGGDIIILGTFKRDLSGQYVEDKELASLMTQYTNVPVYGLWHSSLGLGIVGGLLSSSREQGVETAAIVSELAQGINIAMIAPVSNIPNRYYLDYPVAQKYRIDLKKIPNNATVINSPTGFYTEHKTVLLIVLAIFVFLFLLVFFLAVTLSKKRQAEKQLIDLTSELEERVGLRTKELLTVNKVVIEREEDMQRLLSNLPGVVYRCLNDGHSSMLFLSDGIQSLTGYTAKQLCENKELTFMSIIDERDRQNLVDEIADSISKQTHFIIEYRIRTKDGEARWVSEAGLVVFDANGEVRYLDGFITDISARKAYELEQTKLATAIKQTDDLIIISDINGIIEYVNPAFNVVTGYSNEEALGRNPRLLKSGKQDSTFYKGLWNSITEGKVWRGQMLNAKKNGEEYIAEAVISPIRDQQGEITHFVAVQRDISNEVQLEKELRQAHKLEAMGTLAGGIAHEINTPAQFVNNNLDFLTDSFVDLHQFIESCVEFMEVSDNKNIDQLQKSYDENDVEYLVDEIPQALTQSIDGIKQIANIVSSMKQFAHPGENSKVSTDINGALKSTSTVCRNEWKYIADLEFELEQDLPHVLCYRSELNQVFLNLIVNAAHAIESTLTEQKTKGRIVISTKTTDGFVEIHIKDNGGGIPKEIREKLYDPFFTTKDLGKGTGQGLSIAHSIITDKHGGNIIFETELGIGTTFIISLPIKTVEIS